ncbi:hypothetical protein [Acinetobacter sp. BWR-L5]|uniref:hypothetical protein n=1 Tax=Acinetobacter sp. BWR-L5 TaxID=2815725 RepID=UPI0031FF3E14
MPGFKDIRHEIENELKKYHKEDLMWIYDILLGVNSRTNTRLKFRDIKNLRNFDEIKELIILELIEYNNENEIRRNFELFNQHKKHFIKNELFSDFKKDLRLCLFFISYLESKKEYKKESHLDSLLVSNIKPRFCFYSKNYIYIRFVYYILSKDVKMNELLEAKKDYNDLIRKKINTSLKFKDENFTIWAMEYLRPYSYFLERDFREILNSSDTELFITSYLDFLYLCKPLEYELLTIKMNKAWSQKKFRDSNKVKKDYHLPLTKKSKEELAKLSAFKKLSESDILEQLIHQMFLKEMCDEKENSKY